MLQAVRGKHYTIEEGLSETSSDWFIVGRSPYPVRIDKSLGWRSPENSLPTFVGSVCFLAVGATFDGTSWVADGEDLFIVPAFGVEEVYETGDFRSPSYVRGKIYLNSYEISEEEYDLEVVQLDTSTVRVDSTMGWRSPLETEAPYFIESGVAICRGATFDGTGWTGQAGNYNTPIHTVTKVYEWELGSIFTNGADGTQGPQGPEGSITIISGSGGSGSVIVGTQGPVGPQGPPGGGGGGGSFQDSVGIITNTPEFPDFTNSIYSVTVPATPVDVYLPVGTVSDIGKSITISDGLGQAFEYPITIRSQGSELVGGKNFIQIQNNFGSFTFYYDGVNWQIRSLGFSKWDGYTQTADSTPVAATTTESTLIGAGYGSLIVPANQFSLGESFSLRMGGQISCANNQDLTIRVKTSDSGGNTIALSTAAVTAIGTTTAKNWLLTIDFTIRAIGASGTASIVSNGLFSKNVNAQNTLVGNAFSQVISNGFDTTLDNTLEITAQWGSNNASNTIYTESCLLRKV